MNVALVHDWLTGMRGGERCLEAFCEIFPDAPIYTLVYVKGSVAPEIERHRIIPSWFNRVPLAKTHYRYGLPLFPALIRSFDFQGFDVIVSSSHCVAKGIRVPSGSCHVSYVHTPMRYVWDRYEDYVANGHASLGVRVGIRLFRACLRRWDVRSSQGVYQFIANSHHVADRIKRHYGRTACVIHPPIDWNDFQASEVDEGFYLMVTALAPYKRVDLAIEAANAGKFRLIIIGSGQEEKRLNKLAGPTVTMLGWKPDEVVREYYRRCRAVLFPGEEDFGIVPLEAMANGKPVIAYGKGGVEETVVPLNPLASSPVPSGPPTGVFFFEQSVSSITNAIELFERRQKDFIPSRMRAHVKPFDRANFISQIRHLIMQQYSRFRRAHPC